MSCYYCGASILNEQTAHASKVHKDFTVKKEYFVKKIYYKNDLRYQLPHIEYNHRRHRG